MTKTITFFVLTLVILAIIILLISFGLILHETIKTNSNPEVIETRLVIIDGPLIVKGPTGRAEVNLWIIKDTKTDKEFVYSVGGIANTSICPLNK